ncbi:uncharacterized protein LOC111310803 [Durio zibethinus]|uniref:Uncharacterized protein LOC111310803 n=1 Tax=Durio zibethinus TaxID=66656 RepID=A0A6P6AM47_DURZI|nr:uncharacterized protein LOC111310803 [Durio zibethinus]
MSTLNGGTINPRKILMIVQNISLACMIQNTSIASPVIFLVISVTLFTQGLAADQKHPTDLHTHFWQRFPWVHRSGPAFPPLPPLKWPKPPHNPKVGWCLESFKTRVTSLQDILHSFLRRKPSIRVDCFAAVKAIQDDCCNLIFSRFNNPLFAPLLKKHCSNKGEAAPSPA